MLNRDGMWSSRSVLLLLLLQWYTIHRTSLLWGRSLKLVLMHRWLLLLLLLLMHHRLLLLMHRRLLLLLLLLLLMMRNMMRRLHLHASLTR